MQKLLKKIRYNYFNYTYWKRKTRIELIKPTRIIATGRGIVEYKLIGDSGPVLTSIHGAPGGWDQVYYIFNGLLHSGYRILAWSRPGYLRTPLNSGVSNIEQAELLAALLKKLKIEKTSLVAFSNGGPIAIEFAKKYPEMTESMILEAVVTKKYNMLPKHLIKKLVDKYMLHSSIGPWITYLNARYLPTCSTLMPLFRYGDYKLFELITKYKLVKSNYHNALIMHDFILKSITPFHLRKVGMHNDTVQSTSLNIENLENIKTPTLILHGTSDGDVPFEHAKYIYEKIKDSILIPFNAAPHLLSLTHPYKVADAKLNFLDDIYNI
jgi:pimeloyl-ACP methyl ester carboxylesterase